MQFSDYVKTYVNKAAQFGITSVQMATNLGVSQSVLQMWVAYAQQKNLEYVEANGAMIPDDNLIAEWNLDHPPVVVFNTPFGANSPVAPTGKLLLQMTVTDFEDLLKTLLGK